MAAVVLAVIPWGAVNGYKLPLRVGGGAGGAGSALLGVATGLLLVFGTVVGPRARGGVGVVGAVGASDWLC